MTPSPAPARLASRALRAALAGLFCAVPLAHGQARYPERPIQLVVPFNAPSQPDFLARTLAESMAKTLGQPMVVVNRDGAGGIIAVEGLSKAAPDGYTLGYGPNGQFTIQPHVRKDLKYKVEDFDFICQTNTGVFVVVVGPKSPFQSLKDLLAAAKASPGKLNFASAGQATGPHLAAETLAIEADVKFTHVPFRSVSDMNVQTLSGTVDFMVTAPTVLASNKDYRALAVIGDRPLPNYPNLPLVRDLGFPRTSELPGLLGLYAPKGMPAPALATLRKACQTAVASDEFKSMSERLSTPLEHLDADAMTARIGQISKVTAEVVKKLGL